MRRDQIVYGLIGGLMGSAFLWFLATTAVNNSSYTMMQMMGMNRHIDSMGRHHEEEHEEEEKFMTYQTSMEGMMDTMKSKLDEKTGDEFDKAFLSEMIIHHQGAIDMAKDAQKSAKHDELKSMANDIIFAQTREIEQMKKWQKDWGY